MLVIFTKRYGKISAGTSISEKGKSKSALALRPFTYGKYELVKGRDSFSVSGAEVLKSFYQLGEDVDKYMAASYALELTDKMLEEEQATPGLFNLLEELLELLAKRKKAFWTPVLAFELKAYAVLGCGPDLESEGHFFSVSGGGFTQAGEGMNPLVFAVDDDLSSALKYMGSHPLASLERLALKPEVETKIRNIFRSYRAYHLGIENLKSEGLQL